MKRFIIFLLILAALGGIYNSSVLRNSLFGAFGDHSYRKDDFPDAERHYTDILKNDSDSMLLEADTLYNLGNTLYRLGEKQDGTERVKLWRESVGNYTKSLSIRTDPETEENLAFVQEKLKKEENEQEKKQEQQKQDEEKKKDTDKKTGTGAKREPEPSKTQSGSTQEKPEQPENTKDAQNWKDSGTKKKDGGKETGQWRENEQNKAPPGQSWSNEWSYNPLGGQSKDSASSDLSDADKQEVKKYLEELKQFQKRNGKLLNPEKSGDAGNLSDQIRNFFGSDSFFQDVIPSGDGKKDW